MFKMSTNRFQTGTDPLIKSLIYCPIYLFLCVRCEYDALTGPPTDGDGNELEYFQEMRNCSVHYKDWFG